MATKVEKVLDGQGELSYEPQLAEEYLNFLRLIMPQRIPTADYQQALFDRLSEFGVLKLSRQVERLRFRLIAFGVNRFLQIRETKIEGYNIYSIGFLNSLNLLDVFQVVLPSRPLPVQLQHHDELNLFTGDCKYIINDISDDSKFSKKRTQLVAEMPGGKDGIYDISRVDLLHVPSDVNFALLHNLKRNFSLSKRPFEPLAIARQLQLVPSRL